MKEYELKLQTKIKDGQLEFRILGKLNSNMLEEVWGFWEGSIEDAFHSFGKEITALAGDSK